MLFHFMLPPGPGGQCYYHPCFANEEAEAKIWGTYSRSRVGNCGTRIQPSDFHGSACPPSLHKVGAGAMAWQRCPLVNSSFVLPETHTPRAGWTMMEVKAGIQGKGRACIRVGREAAEPK